MSQPNNHMVDPSAFSTITVMAYTSIVGRPQGVCLRL